MGNFQLPKTTAFDSSGDPVIGAKLYFYITQTSTPANTYQDELNTIPNTNPVIADSAGRFVDIFLDTEIVYKLELKDSSDVTIYTVDPVKPYGIVNTEIPDRLRQVASNPLDYGAIGDGLLNEVIPVQTAINNATGTVDLLGKTYRCDAALSIPPNRRVINGTLNFSQCPISGPLIKVEGQAIGPQISLTSDAICNDSQLNLSSTASIVPGAYALVSSTAAFTAGFLTGEIVRIKSISPTFVVLESGIRFKYASVNSSFRVLNVSSDVEFHDVRVIGGNASPQTGIQVTYGRGVSMQNVDVSNVSRKGIAFLTSIDCTVSDSRVRDIFLADGTGISIDGGSSSITVDSCAITDAMIGASCEGALYINSAISLSNLTIKGSTNHGIFLDKSTYDSKIDGCNINGGQGVLSNGITSYGTNCDISGNKIRGCRVDGISVIPSQSDTYATSGASLPPSKTSKKYTCCYGNSVDVAGRYGIAVASGVSAIDGIKVDGNSITNTGSNAIHIEAQSTNSITDVSVNNNYVDSPSTTGILVRALLTSSIFGLNVSNNSIKSLINTDTGIEINSNTQNNVTNVVVSSNNITGGIGIKSLRCSGISINDNSLNLSSDQPIWATSCNKMNVSNNNIILSADKGILLDGVSSKAKICGNSVDIVNTNSTSPCIFTNSVTGLLIKGNYLSGSRNNVSVIGCQNSNISDNVLDSASVLSVSLSTSTKTIASGNVCTNSPAFMKSIQCTDVVICSNTATVTGTGIEFDGSSTISCNANSIINTSISAITAYFSSTSFVTDITNNRISKLGGDGILFQCNTGASVRGVTISGNNSVGLGNDAIKIEMQGGSVDGLSIKDNTIRTQSARCIHVDVVGSATVDGMIISGNNMLGASERLILIESNRTSILETNKITNYSIVGNILRLGLGGSGITFTGLSDSYVEGFISGNLFIGTNSALAYGIDAFLPSALSPIVPQYFAGLIVGANSFYNFSANTEIRAFLNAATQLATSSSGLANLKE